MGSLKRLNVINTKLSRVLATITIDRGREPELRRVLAEIRKEAGEYLKEKTNA